jgi:methionyl-tRNA formyltransferase
MDIADARSDSITTLAAIVAGESMTRPTHLTLLGFSPVFIHLRAWAKKTGVGVSILTSPDQVAQLEQIGERDFTVLEKLDDGALQRAPAAFTPTGVAVSFGARWIFRKPQLESLFHNRLLNAHGTRLPMDRGGGGFSWRIMRGDRIGSLLLHLVDEGIDTGSIVASEDYVIPAELRTPAAIMGDYESRLAGFVTTFLDKGAPLSGLVGQPGMIGAYYPRLHSPTHGWINWSWQPEDISRFILAFDIPFPGARTCWHRETVTIRQAQLHYGEMPHHPFQAGLVIRNNDRWLVVALSQGACLIVEDVRNEMGESVLAAIKEGDRLFTPPARLEAALEQRVSIGPKGVKERL